MFKVGDRFQIKASGELGTITYIDDLCFSVKLDNPGIPPRDHYPLHFLDGLTLIKHMPDPVFSLEEITDWQ
jgi:hypothetical protein